jgi:heavy metal sensor kinase
MRSIRLSLIVSFLLLMAAALSGVSWFAYQMASRTLEEKEASTRELIEREYEKRREQAEKEFNKSLSQRAYVLASTAIWSDKFQNGLVPYSLRLFDVGFTPQSALVASAWLYEAQQPAKDPRSQVRVMMLWNNVSIEFPESVLRKLSAASPHQYFAIFAGGKEGKLLEHSPSLPEDQLALDQNLKKQANIDPYVFDDLRLGEGGEKLRRVTMKTVVEHQRSFFPPWPGGPGRKGGGPPRKQAQPPKQPPPPLRPVERKAPTIYVQYAMDTAELEASLDRFAAERDKGLADLGPESEEQLSGLRDRLLWLGLIAFLLTGAGGFVMLYLALKPLDRLSDAVSRISEKDFRLPLDGAPLPSELRPIEERLQQTLDLLKRAFAREKQAAADISHELRTPLAALMTTLEVALRKPRSQEEYREILQDCRDSGKHMTQLVERLLALARLDAGADLLRPREVDAAVLAEQCAALVRPLAEAHGLALSVRHQGDAHLKTDPDKLREVLNNLLHNAVQYNKPHGSIDLEVRRDNGSLELEVRDTGIGIAAQAREHIFERFYRADPSRQADGLNAGLGLAIVKGYVDLLGGTIRVDSTEGQGSAFRVRLPAHPEASPN